jgi:hypothetical protein
MRLSAVWITEQLVRRYRAEGCFANSDWKLADQEQIL